jgi:photosystem II stability/assembly factor-like uncharacterized protein
MNKYFKKILFASCLFTTTINAQTVRILIKDSIHTSLRGLNVFDDKIIWTSGNKGTIGKSLDGGETWQWIRIPGFYQTDFRDVQGFSKSSAIVMGVDEPAYILKTIDGGKTWKTVLKDTTQGMFLDAMEFWNEQSGIVIGDPINNKFFIARTFDGGNKWRGLPEENYPTADNGEACFAASGTCVRKLNKAEACFVSGGTKSRLFIRDKTMDIPFTQGKATCGANSVAVKNENILIVVGGDFIATDSTSNNCFITKDGGKTWSVPSMPPHGYRSCIEYLDGKSWVCCGPNGVDYTKDDGNTWTWISKEDFNVCCKAKYGKAVFFAGDDGKIGKLIF